MYWSHKKDDTKTYIIETSSLDGSHRAVVMNCSDPAESLSMDYPTGRLYFVYSESGAILYVDLKTKAVSRLPNDCQNNTRFFVKKKFHNRFSRCLYLVPVLSLAV